MSISIKCSCGKRLSAPDDAIGKRAKCPKCSTLLTVTSADAAVCEWGEDRPSGALAPEPKNSSPFAQQHRPPPVHSHERELAVDGTTRRNVRFGIVTLLAIIAMACFGWVLSSWCDKPGSMEGVKFVVWFAAVHSGILFVLGLLLHGGRAVIPYLVIGTIVHMIPLGTGLVFETAQAAKSRNFSNAVRTMVREWSPPGRDFAQFEPDSFDSPVPFVAQIPFLMIYGVPLGVLLGCLRVSYSRWQVRQKYSHFMAVGLAQAMSIGFVWNALVTGHLFAT